MPKAFLVRKRPWRQGEWEENRGVKKKAKNDEEGSVSASSCGGKEGDVRQEENGSSQQSALCLQTETSVQGFSSRDPENFSQAKSETNGVDVFPTTVPCINMEGHEYITSQCCPSTTLNKMTDTYQTTDNKSWTLELSFPTKITSSFLSDNALHDPGRVNQNGSVMSCNGFMKTASSAFEIYRACNDKSSSTNSLPSTDTSYSSQISSSESLKNNFSWFHSCYPAAFDRGCLSSFCPHFNSHVSDYPKQVLARMTPVSQARLPIHPIPVRILARAGPVLDSTGGKSPDEVSFSSGSSLADTSASLMLDVRSSGQSHFRIGAENVAVGEANNHINNCNSSSNNSSRSCQSRGSCDEEIRQTRKKQDFRAFLESAKVRVEVINDGHGLKNPLLSPDSLQLGAGGGSTGFQKATAIPACPVCGARCDTLRLLQRHVRGHKEIKRYLCAWCGKGFNDTFDLKRHTRTHTGVRPYKCASCGKAFTQRCSLESHCRKIHGHNVPFTFNERRTKIYVCEECGHATSCLDSHFRHLSEHHPGHSALDRSQRDRRQFDLDFCSGESGKKSLRKENM